MLHVWILFHHLRVLAIFSDRSEDEFVILLAIVLQDEADLFPLADLNARGFVPIFPLPSNILILTTRAGFCGSPGRPAEKCP
jgi:hypothetical protein